MLLRVEQDHEQFLYIRGTFLIIYLVVARTEFWDIIGLTFSSRFIDEMRCVPTLAVTIEAFCL